MPAIEEGDNHITPAPWLVGRRDVTRRPVTPTHARITGLSVRYRPGSTYWSSDVAASVELFACWTNWWLWDYDVSDLRYIAFVEETSILVFYFCMIDA